MESTSEPTSACDSPFSEDCIIAGAARLAGLEMSRSAQVIVTDRKALEAAGLVKKSPDYYRIRKLLEDGATVEGAHLGPVEYMLRRRDGNDAGCLPGNLSGGEGA